MRTTPKRQPNFSNFGSLKSTETDAGSVGRLHGLGDFSNFGSLKSTETAPASRRRMYQTADFSNFGSLKSTETDNAGVAVHGRQQFQQFRLVEEH